MITGPKPWMKQPGECHDSKGIPIYPGDLLRSYHFTGKHQKVYYLYHVALMIEGAMRMVNTDLMPDVLSGKNQLPGCMMSQDLAIKTTILCGYGPKKEHYSFEDRPRVKTQEVASK